jgi:hypothetical protein
MLHLAALLLALLLAAPALAQGFTPEQRAEILSILREALRTDPSILRDALAGLEEAEQRERTEARRAAIASTATRCSATRPTR